MKYYINSIDSKAAAYKTHDHAQKLKKLIFNLNVIEKWLAECVFGLR